MSDSPAACIAFEDHRCVAIGDLVTVALAVKRVSDTHEHGCILVFDCQTSRPVELDLRGTAEDVVERLTCEPEVSPPTADDAPRPQPHEPRRRPGRPKLGVVAREVTLLPRHWEWLASQPGGASAALRRLVEQAKRANVDSDRMREARDATYRFALAIAGDEPGFEEAMRALYAGNRADFESWTAAWPADVRQHALHIAEDAFETSDPVSG